MATKKRNSPAQLRSTKKKEEFNLKKEYKLVWKFLKESKYFIYSTIIVFVLFFLLGLFFPVPKEMSNSILKYIEELLMMTEGFGFWQMFGFIFSNNLQSSFIGLFSGIFLGVFPVFFTLFNGYLVGFVSALTIVETGSFLILLRLLPHGIFELPAIFLSFGLGLKIGSFAFQKKKMKLLKKYLEESLRAFVLVILPLLIIAAFIESLLIF